MPTFWIKIYRIQAVDAIEGVLEDGADWHYYIWVWDGEKWLTVDSTVPSDRDDVVVNAIHSFTVKTVSVDFYIALLEDDFWTAADVADISGRAGGGYDNYDGTIPRGAEYGGTYDLRTNSLSGDETIIEAGHYKTSGDYDDSIEVDENDANLWFDVWDNYDLPTANAGVDQTVHTGEKVNFDGSASTASAGSSLVKYEWDFENDGVIDAEGAKTSYTYNVKGQYTVVLRVTDSLGQVDTDTCLIAVLNRAPIASFTYTPTDITIQDAVNFIDTSQDTDGSIVSWYWDFGDGTTSTDRNPTHKYSSEGNYTVTLTVTDNDGAQNVTSKTITVKGMPFYSQPWFPIVIIIIIAVIVVIAAVAKIKRKKPTT
jgi:PKD repeat protein